MYFYLKGYETIRKIRLLNAVLLTILVISVMLFASGCTQKGAN